MTDAAVCSVRKLREARGLTQVELAEAAAVSRQSLSAIEAGRADPSVSLALRLARALECRVEDLFGAAEAALQLDATLVSEVVRGGAAQRVALAFVRDRWVAHALPANAYDTWSQPADALTLPDVRSRARGTRVELLRPPAEARETVVLLGCAPALGLLAQRLNSHPGPGRFLWLKYSSGAALSALKRDLAHVAGVHMPEAAAGEVAPASNLRAIREHLPEGRVEIITLLQWQAGLVVQAGNPLGIRGAADLARRGLRLASREAGSGARVVLEQALEAARVAHKKLLAGALELSGHFEVAHAVAIGAADVGIAMQPAALAHGLDFVPLSRERFDLVFARDNREDARIARMLDVMQSSAFRRDLSALGGYDIRDCGRVVE